MKTDSPKAPYWNPYLAGIALGCVLTGSFLVTGHGLGASGGFARIVSELQAWLRPEHVNSSPAWATMSGGSLNALDHWLVYAVFGVMAGGLVSARFAGRLRLETFKGPNISVGLRLGLALLGGIIVGWASRMARGCTSGQALSGGALLSVGSWAFMFSVFIGGYLVAYLFRKLWN